MVISLIIAATLCALQACDSHVLISSTKMDSKLALCLGAFV